MITNPIVRTKIGILNGIQFDDTVGSGKNQLISVTNTGVMQSLTAFTYECIINMNQAQVTNGKIVEYRNNGNVNIGFNIQINSAVSNAIAFSVGNSTTNTVIISAANALNAFYHIAAVWDGSAAYLFINGVLQGTSSLVGGSIGNPAKNMVIGAFSPTSNTPFGGIMQEMRYSNIARYTANFTPMTTQFSPDANTIMLLHLSQQLTNTVIDSSSNKLTCVFGGTPIPQPAPGYLTNGNVRAANSISRTVASSRALV